MRYQTGPLQPNHDRSRFDCGVDSLNDYLKKQANQDIKKNLSLCFVLFDDENIVKGYYTLSATSISKASLPDQLIKKIPKGYVDLPATLLGRLAIDNSIKGKKFGERLLIDALSRTCEVAKNNIGSMAMILDPINEDAVSFYKHYGFIQLPDSGKMFLPMKTIEKLFK